MEINTMKKKNRLLKSNKLLAGITILVAIIIIVISSLLIKNKLSSWGTSIYYSSQVISSIFVMGGVIIAVWQYVLSSKSAKKNIELEKVQRAIELSEYYKDNILIYYPAIQYIFNESNALPILQKIRKTDVHDFDYSELELILTKQDINSLKNIQYTKEFFDAFKKATDIYGFKIDLLEKHLYIPEEYKINKKSKKKKSDNSNISDKKEIIGTCIANFMNEALNNMEYFALHFKHNTADESVVYQSLHQTYLDLVILLYFNIAKSNINPSKKYYTNVIWLFDKWRNRQLNQNSNHSKSSLELLSTGTIIEELD